MKDDSQEESQEFSFTDEQLTSWLEELEFWGKKHKLNSSELCVVLGFLHQWLKDDLGLEVIAHDVEEEDKGLH